MKIVSFFKRFSQKQEIFHTEETNEYFSIISINRKKVDFRSIKNEVANYTDQDEIIYIINNFRSYFTSKPTYFRIDGKLALVCPKKTDDKIALELVVETTQSKTTFGRGTRFLTNANNSKGEEISLSKN